MDGRGSGLRGGAVGALTAALALAAHGLGGGELPDSAALTFLLIVSAGVGVLAGSVGSARTGVLWLAGGQVVAHETLSVIADHAHPVDSSMLFAHAVAIAAGSVLVASAERLLRAITSVVRTPSAPFASSPRRATVVATAPLGLPTPVPVLSSVSRRGPPSVSAPR